MAKVLGRQRIGGDGDGDLLLGGAVEDVGGRDLHGVAALLDVALDDLGLGGGEERPQRHDTSVGVEDPPVDLEALLGGDLEAQAALLRDATHGRDLEPGQGGVDREPAQLDRPGAVVGVPDGDHGAVVLPVLQVEPHLCRPVVGDLEGHLGPVDHLHGARGPRGRADLHDLLRVGGTAREPGSHEQLAHGDHELARPLGGVAGLVGQLHLDRVAAVAQVQRLLDDLAPAPRRRAFGDRFAIDGEGVRRARLGDELDRAQRVPGGAGGDLEATDDRSVRVDGDRDGGRLALVAGLVGGDDLVVALPGLGRPGVVLGAAVATPLRDDLLVDRIAVDGDLGHHHERVVLGRRGQQDLAARLHDRLPRVGLSGASVSGGGFGFSDGVGSAVAPGGSAGWFAATAADAPKDPGTSARSTGTSRCGSRAARIATSSKLRSRDTPCRKPTQTTARSRPRRTGCIRGGGSRPHDRASGALVTGGRARRAAPGRRGEARAPAPSAPGRRGWRPAPCDAASRRRC